MNSSSWNDLLAIIDGKDLGYLPVGFIIDSPWIPGWYGITLQQYFSSDELWLKSNLKVHNEFPEVWFLPGFWSEYGMCTEPSAFGSRMIFPVNELPHAEKIITDISDSGRLPQPNVKSDGLLPFMINRLKSCHSSISDAGHEVRFAVSRGPFNIASFLMGTTEFMMALAINPEESHRLLRKITVFICDWLSWQKECFPEIDGVLILDDLIGFVGESEFIEFVIPNFAKIFSETGARVRFLHNDAEGLITAKHLGEMNVNMFNFSFNHSMSEIRKLSGNETVLVGNIPPRDVMAAGTPSDVVSAVEKAMNEDVNLNRILWSVGGGMPPRVKSENIRAFFDAVKKKS
jgi:uroporphyrinogen decarboxylase